MLGIRSTSSDGLGSKLVAFGTLFGGKGTDGKRGLAMIDTSEIE
jgi:hypothetical protein